MANPLWDRWNRSLESMRDEWRKRAFEPHAPEDFKKQLLEASTNAAKDELQRHYRRAWADRRTLLDQRTQEDWADVREKVRFLIFRTALAFMIMGVVLLTAYLSKRWELPLPLMRALP